MTTGEQTMEKSDKRLVEEQIKIENQFKSGANWFFWIAGLSIINSASYLTGSSWHFIIGLSVTQFIDGVARSIHGPYGNMFRMIAFMMDLGFVALFASLGLWAKQKSSTGFILGMILYGFDSLMLLLIGSVIGIVFHVLALVFIFRGLQSLQKMEEQASAAVATLPS